jgi:hypothetical protein
MPTGVSGWLVGNQLGHAGDNTLLPQDSQANAFWLHNLNLRRH